MTHSRTLLLLSALFAALALTYQAPATAGDHGRHEARRHGHHAERDRHHRHDHAHSRRPPRPHSAAARRYHRGDYLPPAYYQTRHHVRHHGHHRLRPPGRGQRWVRVDGDYVLVAIATGVIVDLVLNR